MLKLIEIGGLLHHPFRFQLVLTLWGYHFPIPETTSLSQGSLMRVQYPKCAYDPYCELNPILNGGYFFVEVSFYFRNTILE